MSNFVYYIFIKKLYGEVLEIFLILILPSKFVSALKKFITSDHLNTKLFCFQRTNLNN